MRISSPFLFLCLLLSLFQCFSGTGSTSLTVTNNCDNTIWPVVSPPPGDGLHGIPLSPGGSQTQTLPENWSGLVWARTICAATTPAGDLRCATGDLISGAVKPSSPATEAVFGPGGKYAVSVADGYNLPITVVPTNGGCTVVGCTIDYATANFTPEIRAGDVNQSSAPMGIKSSEILKKLCPQAQSNASDYVDTVFSCGYSDFVVFFCGRATGSTPYDDGSQNIYLKNNLDGKIGIGIGIGVLVGILGTLLILIVWRLCRKIDFEPCSFSCCHLFSCSCCPEKYY